MTTKTHTYSDGSQIEQGADKGKGWLSTLKGQHRKRQILGRKAILVDDMSRKA